MVRLADFQRSSPFSGVVFDFNGTLFWDTYQHDQAWIRSMERRGVKVTSEELFVRFHGKPNAAIIQGLLGSDLPEEEMWAIEAEKEQIYQGLCLETKLEMAPGAVRLLDFLKEKNFRFTVATSAPQTNIDFYFRELKIGRWFDREKIVFFDGTFPGKPNPAFYQRALGKIECVPAETLIFEDAPSGILAAENAACPYIVCVNSEDGDYSSYSYPVIRNFDEIDREIFG